jgi:hypothetical protein
LGASPFAPHTACVSSLTPNDSRSFDRRDHSTPTTHNTQHTTHSTRKPILEYYRQVQTTTMIRVSSRNIRIHSKNKLARHFLFLAYYHKLRRPMPPTQPHQNNNTTALSVSPCQIRRLLTIYTARQSSHFLTRFVESE